MRVIAGIARSIPLKTIESSDTRPTTDRIKETLFNILQFDLAGCTFLDLFSGSGGIGIEALSRGAGKAYFVENSRKAVECIRYNLQFTKLAQDAVIMECDAATALSRLYGKEKFDIIFMDPPYQKNYEKDMLKLLSNSSLLHEDTLIIVEAALETDFAYADELGYSIIKEKRYKNNKHVFIKRTE